MFSFITKVMLNVSEPMSIASRASLPIVKQNRDTMGNLSICILWILILLWNYAIIKHISVSGIYHTLSALYHTLICLGKYGILNISRLLLKSTLGVTITGRSEECNPSNFSVRGRITDYKMSCRKHKYWMWNAHSKTGSPCQARGWEENILVMGKDF